MVGRTAGAEVLSGLNTLTRCRGGREPLRRPAPGSIPRPRRRGRRGGVRGPGGPARADGARCLPQRPARPPRRPGRLPGDVPGPGVPGGVDPAARRPGRLAPGGRAAGRGAVQGRSGPAAGSTKGGPRRSEPTTRGPAASPGRNCTRRSAGCRSGTGSRWCSATWRGSAPTRRPSGWGAPRGRSSPDCRGLGSGCAERLIRRGLTPAAILATAGRAPGGRSGGDLSGTDHRDGSSVIGFRGTTGDRRRSVVDHGCRPRQRSDLRHDDLPS